MRKELVMISSYCGTEKQLAALHRTIDQLDPSRYDVMLSSPLSLVPVEKTKFFLHLDNPLKISDYYSYRKPNPKLRLEFRPTTYYWAALYQVKNMARFARFLDYDIIHHLTYDVVSPDSFLSLEERSHLLKKHDGWFLKIKREEDSEVGISLLSCSVRKSALRVFDFPEGSPTWPESYIFQHVGSLNLNMCYQDCPAELAMGSIQADLWELAGLFRNGGIVFPGKFHCSGAGYSSVHHQHLALALVNVNEVSGVMRYNGIEQEFSSPPTRERIILGGVPWDEVVDLEIEVNGEKIKGLSPENVPLIMYDPTAEEAS